MASTSVQSGDSPTKKKVLLLGQIEWPSVDQNDRAQQDWAEISKIAEVITPKATKRDEFIDECRRGDLDGASVIYRTFVSSSITGNFDEELVAHLPKSIKFICHNGAGYDSVDIPACTNHGILVSNTPTVVNNSTANTALWLILGASRLFYSGMLTLQNKAWRGAPPVPYGIEVEGKTLGILGMGGIGRDLRDKIKPQKMKVLYHNRNRLPADLEDGAVYATFDELLAKSDILTIHVPLNPQTKRMISGKEFAKMKDGVIFINTARGAIVDEEALAHAILSGKVRSCGLDVFQNEPEVHSGLLGNPRVLTLPHMGTWTDETLFKMEQWNMKNVKSALTNNKLESVVAEQAAL